MIKKGIKKIFLWLAALIVIITVFNIKVSTKQGINYKVSTLRIPLYLKVLDFFDRNFNYRLAVERILGDTRDEREKAIKIFEWTHKNIRKVPEGFPVIDDHVWYTIVRGYGREDQSSDVFATLCNYAGLGAFYELLESEKGEESIVLSFVKINGRWNAFDPFSGVYFKNKNGSFSDLYEISKGDWSPEGIDDSIKSNLNYAPYFKNMRFISEVGLVRPRIQSPLKRLQYEIKKMMRIK